jgi:hypothetical protein
MSITTGWHPRFTLKPACSTASQTLSEILSAFFDHYSLFV